MESRAKLFGHAIHPMLITLPLGLFVFAIVSDVIYLITGDEVFAAVAYYNIAGGVIGGLLAAVFGFRDYAAIPGGTRAKRVGLLHGYGNLAVLILFAFSWILRNQAEGYVPPALALVASFAAAAVSLFTAWLGGELVERLGVGVDHGANLNAPSSLVSHWAEGVQGGETTAMAAVPVTGDAHDAHNPYIQEHGASDVHPTDPNIARDVDRSQRLSDADQVIDEP